MTLAARMLNIDFDLIFALDRSCWRLEIEACMGRPAAVAWIVPSWEFPSLGSLMREANVLNFSFPVLTLFHFQSHFQWLAPNHIPAVKTYHSVPTVLLIPQYLNWLPIHHCFLLSAINKSFYAMFEYTGFENHICITIDYDTK